MMITEKIFCIGLQQGITVFKFIELRASNSSMALSYGHISDQPTRGIRSKQENGIAQIDTLKHMFGRLYRIFRLMINVWTLKNRQGSYISKN